MANDQGVTLFASFDMTDGELVLGRIVVLCEIRAQRERDIIHSGQFHWSNV